MLVGAPGAAVPLPGLLVPRAWLQGGNRAGPVFPPLGTIKSVSELLAPGPVLHTPGIGSPPHPRREVTTGQRKATAFSKRIKQKKDSDSSSEGWIPDVKNKGINPSKEGCEIPPDSSPGR